ncbi:MAG: hypothetical protein K8S94_02780 [Planctomycetia bacterium]|nr:hypothetical protein [Planctomycetia bacterium]
MGIACAAGLALAATCARWLTIPAWAQIGLATLTWCGSMTLAAATLAATAATLDVPPSIAPRIARRARGGLFVVLAGSLALLALVWLAYGGSWLGADTSAGPDGMYPQGRVVFRLLNLATFAIAGYAWSAFALWALLCDVVLWDVIRIIQSARGNHPRS